MYRNYAIDGHADTDQMLASYMTHELRAPLISIRSALGILDEQIDAPPASDARQILTLALRNTERLDSLINDILDYGRLQAGRMAMTLEALRPEALILEAADSMRSWAASKSVAIVCAQPQGSLPRCLADRRRTVQVLINLLSNAIKFTPEGGRIEVSAAPGRNEHLGTIAFTVKDTGPGIPDTDIERIFRCFEQSALGAKTSKGTGLGLTLAKAMVELQGGQIWAESPQGLGATLIFTLPIPQSDMTRPVRAYPKRAQYHGLLVNWFRRLNSLMLAIFA
jgi:signal transduction histidine kinase